jgi:hypothetical protein
MNEKKKKSKQRSIAVRTYSKSLQLYTAGDSRLEVTAENYKAKTKIVTSLHKAIHNL